MGFLIGHLLGDYILQNDWQANGKKVSSFICAVHCLLYTLAIWGCTWWPWYLLPIVFIEHFIQDRWTLVRKWMHLVGQDKFADFLGPWSIIVVDNVLHLAFLFALSEVVTCCFK